MNIESIIFDLGGVLVNWDPKNVYLKVFNGDEEKTNWFLNTICTFEWNAEQDGGRTIAEAEKMLIKNHPEYKDLIKLYYKEWHNMFSGVIEENVEIFKQLITSKKYKIYALTNWSAEKWDKALELFPFFKDFDGVVVSGKEKCKKPEKQLFEIIFNRFNIAPASTIYIDDNYENYKAGKSLGLKAIHYHKTDLKAELNKMLAESK
jgi:2-haloacid dehalogenase